MTLSNFTKQTNFNINTMLDFNTDKESNKNIYSNPGYFGAYLNMARHNVFKITNQIVSTFTELGGEELIIKDDEDIADKTKNVLLQVFNNDDLPSELKLNVLNYLIAKRRQHFPLLNYFLDRFKTKNEGVEKYFNDETLLFKSIQTFFEQSFTAIEKFRNDFTHYIEVNANGEIVEKTYTVEKDLAKNIKQLLKTSIKATLERHKETQQEEDFKFVQHVKLIEDNELKLTDHGFYFFISLFLERGYAFQFLKKLTGFKNETTPSFRATLKVFTAFCLKLPKEKVVNENIKQSLLMEMLNELGKCPKLLFNKLSEEDQKEFQPEISTAAERNIELNSMKKDEYSFDDFQGEVKSLVSRKRYTDRFAYFALRFIDELDIFKNIRFQITLGKLLFSPNDVRSKIILGEEQPRVVTKTVRAYGKLSDFAHKEEQVLRELPGNTNEWKFDQFAPHYNIENNKIAFCCTNETKYPTLKQKDERINQASGFLSVHALPKMLALAVIQPVVVEIAIEKFKMKNDSDILNLDKLNEIKAKLDFGNDPQKLTRKIIDQSKNPKYLKHKERKARADYADYMDNRNKNLNEVLTSYKITHSQLPGMVKDYLLNINPPSLAKRISTFLKEEQLEIKQALKDIEQKETNAEEIKLGELATFLTRDIINMIEDKELKEKLTSPYFNRIQHDIAYFGKSKSIIIELFNELGILGNKGHVFLKKEHLNNCAGIIEFYKFYLNKKKAYLQNLRENIKAVYGIDGEKPVNIKLPYKYRKLREKYKLKEITSYLNKKKTLPINLPLNIFDAAILRAFSADNISDKTGLSNLLAQHLNNDTQPFYNFKRVYTIDKQAQEIDVVGKLNKSIRNEYGKWVFENEKKIRYELTKDRILKLMCLDLLKKQETDLKLDASKLKLNNISKNTPTRNFLNNPVRFRKKITKPEYYIVAEDNEATKEQVKETIAKYERGEIKHIKYWYTWTVKDYGAFNDLALDRRLPGLLAFFETNKKIPVAVIDYELKEYNKYWHKIIDEITKLEEAIFKKDKDGIIALHNRDKANDDWHPHIRFKYYLEWMSNNNIKFDAEPEKNNEDFIKNIRNKFSHSEFPTFGKIRIEKIKKDKADEFHEKHLTEGYKGKTYRSIVMQVEEKLKAKTKYILKQIAEL